MNVVKVINLFIKEMKELAPFVPINSWVRTGIGR